MTVHTPPQTASAMMSATNFALAKVLLVDAGSYPGQSNLLNQSWTLNGTGTPDWTFNDSSSTSNGIDSLGPTPRVDGVMSYDGTNVVLYGGKSGSSLGGVLQDTWLWNGSVWTKQSPATVPFGRYKAELGILNGTGAVMFGGRTISDMLLETWVWTQATSTWSQVSVANGAGPAARVDHCMAGNFSSPVVVLFGGAGTNSQFNDTWKFNGTTWTLQSPATSPSVRSQASMAYATTGALWVMFGGKNEYNYLNETWTYNGTTWTQVTGTQPGGRYGAQMAYDSISNKVILFGGVSATTNLPLNDTWSFDAVGLTWTQL